MLTAEIARQQLTDEQVTTLEDILGDWSQDFPGMCGVVSASVWPDLIKCSKTSSFCAKSPVDNIHLFDDWHFDDRPYNPDNVKLPLQSSNWKNEPSGTWTLAGATQTFGSTHTRFAYNLMLRFAIHIIGDLHQPLHAVEGFFNDKAFGNLSEGDEGGNKIFLKNSCTKPLHMYWDAGACNYQNSWNEKNSDQAELTANATALIAKYPKQFFAGRYKGADSLSACWAAASGETQVRDHGAALCNTAFLSWANDTYNIAATDAYTGIQTQQEVSEQYAARTLSIVEQQFALGGYRLADLLRLVADRAKTLPPKNKVPAAGDSQNKLLLAVAIFFAGCSLVLLLALVLVCRRLKASRVDSASIAGTQLLGNA